MSDPRNNPPRMSEPKKSNSIVYVIGGLLLAAVLAYFLMSGRVDRAAIPAAGDAPAATETPATAPATAEPAAPATPATPAPATTAPAEPAPTATPPATPPAAPANP
jgi:cell division septation protein DedD